MLKKHDISYNPMRDSFISQRVLHNFFVMEVSKDSRLNTIVKKIGVTETIHELYMENSDMLWIMPLNLN